MSPPSYALSPKDVNPREPLPSSSAHLALHLPSIILHQNQNRCFEFVFMQPMLLSETVRRIGRVRYKFRHDLFRRPLSAFRPYNTTTNNPAPDGAEAAIVSAILIGYQAWRIQAQACRTYLLHKRLQYSHFKATAQAIATQARAQALRAKVRETVRATARGTS
jgi:hypothetical protein